MLETATHWFTVGIGFAMGLVAGHYRVAAFKPSAIVPDIDKQ